MPREQTPIVGAWYETEDGQTFRVTAVNPPTGTIEIQYIDGRMDEIDAGIWAGMALDEVESPDDWHESMDDSLWPREEREE